MAKPKAFGHSRVVGKRQDALHRLDPILRNDQRPIVQRRIFEKNILQQAIINHRVDSNPCVGVHLQIAAPRDDDKRPAMLLAHPHAGGYHLGGLRRG